MAKKQTIDFDWDPRKASQNRFKHDVSFELAMSVFGDPLAFSIFDEDHSDVEERWITMGMARDARILVVVHMFRDTGAQVLIRIISARPATKRESLQYREGHES